MKIDRLLGILNILSYKEKTTIQELAKRFEVSKRTIFRDLETLEQAGIPIVTQAGYGGGIALIEGYKHSKCVFSEKDIQNIFIGLSGLMSIDKNRELINLMAKIIPDENENMIAKSNYIIDLGSWFKDSITKEKITFLNQAIETYNCIEIEYISKKSRIKREVQPYKLIFKQSYWYVYAFCERADEFRLFKVKRIASYNILKRKFQPQKIGEIKFKEIDNQYKTEKNIILN